MTTLVFVLYNSCTVLGLFSIHSYLSVLLSFIAEFVFTKRMERGTTPMFAVNTPITRGLWPEYLSLVTIVSIRRLQPRGGMTPHPIKTYKAWTILKLATFVASGTLNVFHIKTLRVMLNTTTVLMPTSSCLELHVLNQWLFVYG